MLDNTLLKELFRFLKLNRFKRIWRRKNKDNGTIPMSFFPQDLVSVGKMSYGELNVVTFNNKTRLKIGSYCSIAQHVTFMLDVEHRTDTVSTFPFKTKSLNLGDEAFSKGNIIVDDDVWIGYGATIMSGVHIGQGAVIAARAVVTKDVPPYAVVGGGPAKVIKYRFSQELIDELLKVDYSRFTYDTIKKNIGDIYTKLTDVRQLERIPKSNKQSFNKIT